MSDKEHKHEHHLELEVRQDIATTAGVSTCGYLDGKRQQPRTAEPGWDCRVDTKNS